MSFWENTTVKYRDLVELPEDRLILLVNSMSRQDIIDWLSWNDGNDEQSLKELGNVMSRDEGIEILLRHIAENRVS